MTLLWVDGFESYGTTIGNAPSPSAVMARKYFTIVSENFFDVETGRNGVGRSIQIGISNGRFHTYPYGTDRTIIMGFAFKYETVGQTAFLSNLFTNGSWGMTLWFDGMGGFKILNNSSNELAGGAVNCNLRPGRWYWVEWKVYCDNTAGTVDVRVGDKDVLNLSGLDTQFTGSNYYNQCNFKDNTGILPFIDDFYMCNGAGSDNNDFLGNGLVECLRPDGDSAVAWTPTGASTNYDEVDEAQHDSGTTNVASSTANQQDLYTYDATANLTDVKGLMVSSVAAVATVGAETMQAVAKSVATESLSANLSVSATGYYTKPFVVEQDPDASAAWTPATVDAALFGIKYI